MSVDSLLLIENAHLQADIWSLEDRVSSLLDDNRQLRNKIKDLERLLKIALSEQCKGRK